MTESMRDGMKYCQFTEDSNLEIIREIGDGGYGTVHYAMHTTWGQLAIKSLKNNANHCNGYLQALLKEVNIHSALRHANVVQFYGFLSGPKHHGIVMEYLCNGSLEKFIDNGKYVDEKWYPMKHQWAYDVASGMCFIHNVSPPIIHMDLKLSNVLLDHGYKAKITDFGISEYRRRTGSSARPRSGARGTLQYTSPELFANINSEPSPSMDVYAYAILLWELYTENIAFQEVVSDMRISLGVQQGQRPDIDQLRKFSPKDIPDLVQRCWSTLPEERPGYKEITLFMSNDINDDNFQVCLSHLRSQKSPPVINGSTTVQTDGPSSIVGMPPDFSLCEKPSSESEMIGPGQRSGLTQDLRDLELTSSIPVQRRTNTFVNQTDYSHLPASGFQDLHPPRKDSSDLQKPSPHSYASNILQTLGPIESPGGLAALEDLKKPGKIDSFSEEPRTLPPMLRQRELDLLSETRQEICAKQQRMMDMSMATDAEAFAIPEKPSMLGNPSFTDSSFASSSKSSSCSDKQKYSPSEPSSSWTQDSSGSIHLVRGEGSSRSEINISGGALGGNIMMGDNNTLVVYNKGNVGSSNVYTPPKTNRAPKQPKKKITVQKKLAPDEAIRFLSKHIGNKWKELARNLGFANGELDAIHHDYRGDGLREVIFQMLYQWRLREGDAASLKVMAHALIAVKLGPLCEKLAEF